MEHREMYADPFSELGLKTRNLIKENEELTTANQQLVRSLMAVVHQLGGKFEIYPVTLITLDHRELEIEVGYRVDGGVEIELINKKNATIVEDYRG